MVDQSSSKNNHSSIKNRPSLDQQSILERSTSTKKNSGQDLGRVIEAIGIHTPQQTIRITFLRLDRLRHGSLLKPFRKHWETIESFCDWIAPVIAWLNAASILCSSQFTPHTKGYPSSRISTHADTSIQITKLYRGRIRPQPTSKEYTSPKQKIVTWNQNVWKEHIPCKTRRSQVDPATRQRSWNPTQVKLIMLPDTMRYVSNFQTETRLTRYVDAVKNNDER